MILLDENGKEFKSVEFARWLENKQQTTQKLVFVIGGPYGFSDDIYNRADEKNIIIKDDILPSNGKAYICRTVISCMHHY